MTTQGDRVKEVRKQRGDTLEKFGAALGVSKVAISNIENGNRNLTEQMLKSICREFNVSEQWLRTGEGEMFMELDKEEELMRWAGEVLAADSEDFRKRFVKMLMGLPPEGWELLAKMAEQLIAERKKD